MNFIFTEDEERFRKEIHDFCQKEMYGDKADVAETGVGLGFFSPEFYRKAMSVPAGFSFYLIAFLGFVAAENILNGTCHDMMYARKAIGRGRAFIKYKGGASFPGINTLFEDVIGFPVIEDLCCNFDQIKSFVFVKLHDNYNR